jgi:hypothetical protein
MPAGSTVHAASPHLERHCLTRRFAAIARPREPCWRAVIRRTAPRAAVSWQGSRVAMSGPVIAFVGGCTLAVMFDYDAWRELVMPGAVANGWSPAPPGDSWHCVLDRWVRGDDTGNPSGSRPDRYGMRPRRSAPSPARIGVPTPKAAVHERFPIATEVPEHPSSPARSGGPNDHAPSLSQQRGERCDLRNTACRLS